MFKNIKIGTKITALVLGAVVFALAPVIIVGERLTVQNVPTDQTVSYMVTLSIVIVLVALIAAIIFSRILTRSLVTLKTTMSLLGQGVLPEKIQKKSEDEIGEMTETVNRLVEGLHKTADFAHKIGEGQFEAEFKPMSKEDNLGLALLDMRDSIQESAKRDEERNWIVTGVAEIGDILRSNNDLDELGDKIAAYLTNKIGAIQGALYVVSEEEAGKFLLEMKASYAYNKKKYLKATFRFAEGLVGQAAAERSTILRTEIPDSYVSVTSGLLGDRKPKCLLVVPLMTVIGSEKVVYGALEFAGFEKFTPRNVQFVNEVSEIIARTVFNIKVNAKTQRLLEMSQRQSEELQQQQEILQQNAEEMVATQEELRRTNVQLEYQVEQVVHAQKRLQTLLENASEVILIYEKDHTVRYASPSVSRILGYTQEEIIGTDDISHVHEEGREAVNKMFDELLAHPGQKHTVQYSYHKNDGERIWLEATGTNLLDDPAIEGVLINASDITERLRAEREQRMRSQMQSLSENSPDLIIRFDKQGKIFYINPMIEVYAGQRKDTFAQRSLDELVAVDTVIVEAWRTILSQVMQTGEKVATEMDFPSTVGNRMMQVNAIPELNEQNAIESVLFVLHDITERKMTEIEISSKNKKISESINYAKRIQGAILPDSQLIKQVFPDAFILYKPRDVVSGDFPWFLQRGDDLYVAAVDCTGHGVPGALISLIGYFLLNNITESGEMLEPGEILDRLDKGVAATLKQDGEDSSSRDGMDIALCRINLKTNTLQYSGAHRPLYFLHEGQLTEIKGDKFPIGGGQYKDRTSFVTTTIRFTAGDSAFFCSDGFPDQFGGPDDRKFSPKRIRDIITANQHMTMGQMHGTFDFEFENWRGTTKQTDDVLMIGIGF